MPTLTKSSEAIRRLDLPEAMRRRTSSSRSLKGSGSTAADGGAPVAFWSSTAISFLM